MRPSILPGTVNARYCCEPRDVNGANPVMKKWSRGNGTIFTACKLYNKEMVTAFAFKGRSFQRSLLNLKLNYQFPQISIQLAREPEAGRHTGHCCAHQMVEIAICGSRQLKRTKTDIVECLVIDTKHLVGVFDQLMDTQGGVIHFTHPAGHLR